LPSKKSCFLCAGSDFAEVLTMTRPNDPQICALEPSGTARIVRCRSCGLMRIDPFPEEKQIPLFYPEESYPCYREEKNSAGFKRIVQGWVVRSAAPAGWNLFKWLIKILLFPVRRRVGGVPKTKQSGPVLDAGCGDGTFLDLLKEAGWQVEGFEMSHAAAEAARKRGLPVQTGTIESIRFPDRKFAAVRFWHVLEHLPNPEQALEKAAQWLQPSGELIVGIPNAASFFSRLFGPRWSAWEAPRHLYHFTPDTIRRLLEKNGFRSIRITHCSVGTGLSSLLGEKAVQFPILRTAGLAIDLLLDIFQHGDSLEVHAIRREGFTK
jgi:2-polyprenyl-3-methyl-5-hydroxy-6-metoxy-1,4-benzoquinol methylase